MCDYGEFLVFPLLGGCKQKHVYLARSTFIWIGKSQRDDLTSPWGSVRSFLPLVSIDKTEPYGARGS